MSFKYEMINDELKYENPIYVHVYEVLSISAPIVIEYPRGIYEPRLEIFYDVAIDDGREVRMKEEFGKQLQVGDLVQYNIIVDDFTKFDPDNYLVRLNLVV